MYRPGPEKTLQNEVIRYLEALGVYCWAAKAIPLKKRKNSIKIGVSDVLGILPDDGRMLAIELKSKRGTVSPEQMVFLERVAKDGGVSGVARSLQDVIDIIRCGLGD